jgi:hypothetical protein
MQKLGASVASGCGFTIDELLQAQNNFEAAGAKVSVPVPLMASMISFPLPINSCSVN